MKFETSQCPLCGKMMQLRKIAGVTVFSCLTPAAHHTSHYEVEFDAKTSIQHIYLGRWSIDNFAHNHRSKIFESSMNQYGRFQWRLVTEVSRIPLDREEDMLELLERQMK